MGELIDGVWHVKPPPNEDRSGKFKRRDSVFRNWITQDGSPGPRGDGGFAAEPGRYHLYVSWACPWAHRTLIMRKLKGLEDMIGLSVSHWFMGDYGWDFREGRADIPDSINGIDYLHQLYSKADPNYTGKATVPALWDKERDTIVSNESSEIIRMFNSAFDEAGAKEGDFYPEKYRDEIDKINARVYSTLNNGVYKAGFARSQEAYEEAVFPLFETLDWLEELLAGRRYLAGECLSEADIRLFTTLIRFDPVYHGHFKCNRKRIVDYPNLWAYTREIFQIPGVAETVNLEHIRKHYYQSHESVNPTRIVAVGPDLDYWAPHGREGLQPAAQ